MPLSLARKIARRILDVDPIRLYVVAFALFIWLGGVLLSLPIATRGAPLGLIDALFTATSAACVTGLTVVHIDATFSGFGQLVLLCLIEVGGLGIMTFSTMALLFSMRRVGFGSRSLMQETFTVRGTRDMRGLTHDILRLTVVIQAAGAAALFVRFLFDYSAPRAFYLAVFHAISAFCNAGFSLFPHGLEPYLGDFWVNTTVAILVILGGLGFSVITELRHPTRRHRRPGHLWQSLTLHTKVVLVTSAALVVFGALFIGMMEWRNTLATLPIRQRVLAAFFQSVTTRTAGFNTLPIGDLANETLLLMVLMMFVGGSSGSTSGGIKTGTFATLLSVGFSRLLGHEHPKAFHRTISPASVSRAMSVFMVCSLVVVAATLSLQVSEVGTAHTPVARGMFLDLLFEAVSAFGTVGLTTGITPVISSAGKLTLIAVMFLGRLGPVVVAAAVSRQHLHRYHYAEEGLMIG